MIPGLAQHSPLARAIPADLRNDGMNAAYERHIDDLVVELAEKISQRRAA